MRAFVFGMLLMAGVLAAAPVFAEGFVDVFGGATLSNRATATIRSNVAETGDHVNFRSEAMYGIRGGYWLKNLPWLGFGGDFSSLHARGTTMSFDIVPVTPMVLFRAPLYPEQEIPQGRLQPYIGIGPSISLYTHVHADFGPPTNDISGNSSIGSAVGFQLPAGAAVQLSKRVALFSEYRLAYYKLDVDQDLISQVFGSVSNNDNLARNIKADVVLHNILVGISFRF